MVELKNVSKFYNDNNIVTVGLRNISLKLNKGEFVAITGDSGSGKSTLLNVISSIDTYDEGEILYYGNETFYFNQNDSDIFRKNNVSFIFQKYNIVDSYTVLQNVMLPLLIQGKDEKEAEKEALEIIKRVGLENRISNKGSNLSGGEKQRCVIARALATNVPILACDEPTGNLDRKTSEEIIKLIKEVSKEKLVLIVTHDYDSIKDVCTRKIKLSDGEIIEDITFKEGTEEEKKELVLKDSKPSKKTLFKLAFLNIFSTPKKTVFSSFVFIFVSLVFLLLSLFFVQLSYEENYTYNENYGIISENRMIIYADNHESLDMEKLSPILKDYEYYENAFFEEKNTYFIVDRASIYGCVTFNDIDYELIEGTSATKEDEFVLVIPYSDYYTNVDSSHLGKELGIVTTIQFQHISPIGKLVGIGVSREINKTYLVANNANAELKTKISNIMINSDVTLYYTSSQTNRTNIQKEHIALEGKSYFLVPTSFKDDIDFMFNIKNIYNISYDIDIIYSDEVAYPVFVVNDDYINGDIAPKFEGIKEITVYTDNVKKLAKEITRLGYDVSIPSKVVNEKGFSLILLYLYSIIIVAALAIMFFISFAIIQRIYLTKTKDYSIFRTLGLVSKDLKKVLNIEVIVITFISLVFGAILTNLIIIVTQIDLYKYVSFILIALYVIVMLIFGLLTSNRLNNKIFKNSVYQSLKEGSE